MGSGRTPTVQPVPEREGRGWPTTVPREDPPTNDNRRRQALGQTCFQETSAVKRDAQQPGADRHLESCIEAEHSSLKLLVLETGDPRGSRRASYTKTPSTNVEEESRIIKQIAQRNETPSPRRRLTRRPNTSSRTGPRIPRFRRIRTLTELLMWLSQVREGFLSISLCTEGVGEGNPIIELWLDLRYSERPYVPLREGTLEKKAHSESSRT